MFFFQELPVFLTEMLAQSSIPTSGTFFCGDLVMKIFLRPFSLPPIQEEQLSVTGERMCTKYW